MIMIENYLSELIWNNFMKNKYVQKGLKALNINKTTAKKEVTI